MIVGRRGEERRDRGSMNFFREQKERHGFPFFRVGANVEPVPRNRARRASIFLFLLAGGESFLWSRAPTTAGGCVAYRVRIGRITLERGIERDAAVRRRTVAAFFALDTETIFVRAFAFIAARGKAGSLETALHADEAPFRSEVSPEDVYFFEGRAEELKSENKDFMYDER